MADIHILHEAATPAPWGVRINGCLPPYTRADRELADALRNAYANGDLIERSSLEAADTRLLAAAEAALAVLDTAEQERDAHDEPNRMVMDGDSYVAALSKLRAAIEQHKEGRS